MKTQYYLYLFLFASVLGLCLPAGAATYSGNGNIGFGGPIGLGSLTLSDNGTTVSGTLTRGGLNGFNDALVLYIDSVSGGFSDTSGFADAGDGLRKAISGFDGGTNRSVLTMPSQSSWRITRLPWGPRAIILAVYGSWQMAGTTAWDSSAA